MSAPSSDSPAAPRDVGTAAPVSYHTRTHSPPPDPLDSPTASVAASAGEFHTRAFEGSDSPTSFPTPDDRYQLIAFLARGGMGEVWTARDRVLNREVALKLLRNDLKERTPSASRFVEEARITGKLQHPGIPPVHDLGTLRDGRPFIAMKLIRGRTLADQLGTARPSLPELLRTFEGVCQAVAYAHDRRVIHRDLKPSNVMVGAFDEVQVMDWGLAKVLGEGVPATPDAHPPGDHPTAPPVSVIESDRDPGSQTRAGSLLGTPAYMPPEQAKGDIDRTDTRSDVFALGAMLCELLTGRPPYWAPTAQEVLALAITGQLVPAVERLNAAEADPELVALAKRCLQADPNARPADAKQVAAAVAAYRAGVEGRLREAERERAAAEARLVEQRKRKRVQQALAGAAVVIVAGVAGGAWWADRQAADREIVRRANQAEVDRLAAQQQADAEARTARNAQAVEFLLSEVNAALVADDAEKAAVPFALIEKRLTEGGVGASADRVARARADLTMLRALDAADEAIWAAEDYKLRVRRSTAAWDTAFRGYGIDPGRTPIDTAASVVNGSVIRERLLLALDLWFLNLSDPEPRVALRNLLRNVDADPYRNGFRTTALGFDLRFKQSLLDDPAALRQPARFAAVLGQVYQFSASARERVLRPALERTPDNVPLIYTMLSVLESTTTVRTESQAQQLRWAQAATSLRPTSKVAWRSLGRAHWDRGQIDDAVRCYRRAVRLDLRDYNSWTQLCAVLLRTNDPEAALEAADRALALNPDFASARNNRGAVFQRQCRFAEALREFEQAIESEARSGLESSATYNSRGFTRMRLGDYAGAITDFKEALRITPDSTQAESNLSNAVRWRRGGGGEPVEAPPPREVMP